MLQSRSLRGSAGPTLALAARVVGLLWGPAVSDARPPAETELRLITWNVGTVNPWGPRLPADHEGGVADFVALARADVVTLQEVASLEQIERLQARLARRGLDYEAVVIRNAPTRAGGRMSATLHRGPALEERHLETSTEYVARAVVLPDLTVVNVHGPATSHDDRRDYFLEVIEWVETLPGPVVLAGDFNLNASHGAGLAAFWPWHRKVDQATYAALAEAYPLRTDVGSTTLYRFALDHVMATAGRIQHEQVVHGQRTFPQDHAPVLVELAIPAKRAGAPEPAQRREGQRREGLSQALAGVAGGE